MTIQDQIIHANHKLGRNEAVLDCMNAIEAEQELLYEQIEARQQEMRSATKWDMIPYDPYKDVVIIKLRAQIDILYVMHKKFVSL